MAFYNEIYIVIIYLIVIMPTNEKKFIEAKNLNSDFFFVVFDTGLYVYDNNLAYCKFHSDFSEQINDFDNIIILKHIYEENIFIFCLIKDKLFIYDDNKSKLFKFEMTSLIDIKLLEYKYYSIIPYNKNSNLNLVIYTIEKEIICRKKNCREYTYRYYNYYINFNIKFENDNLSLISLKNSFYEVYPVLFNEKNLCYFFDSFSTIKCIYYQDKYYDNLDYNIIESKFYNSYYYFSYYEYLIFEYCPKHSWEIDLFETYDIVSSKSKSENYLVCSLYIINYYEIYNYYKKIKFNITECILCEPSDTFDDCPIIENSYYEGCSNIETYYFTENDRFVLVCEIYNAFILSIIDDSQFKVIDTKIIYINCTDDVSYKGKFSIFYNMSTDDYNIITDYNFTLNSKCSFYKSEIQNQVNNISMIEIDKDSRNKTKINLDDRHSTLDIISDINYESNKLIENNETNVIEDSNNEMLNTKDLIFDTNIMDSSDTLFNKFDSEGGKSITNLLKEVKTTYVNVTQILTDTINTGNKNINFNSINETSISTNSKYETTNIFSHDKINKTNANILSSINEIAYNTHNLTSKILKINNTSYIKEEPTTKIIEEVIHIEKETTKKTKEEIIDNIVNLMSDKQIGVNYEIKGEDFTIIIKPTNSPPLPNTTHVDFNECEKIIRKEYNISNTSIITFFQMEINNEDKNALYNQIKYATYDDKLQELDLSLCKDVQTQIHYTLKDNINLDLSTVSNFKKMGVDVLNIKDDFFTNLCYAYSSSDNDMILEDRIKYIFQNYSLCEEGCTYNNINIDQNTVSCNCKIKGNISLVTTPLTFGSAKETSIFDSNIGVSKCYSLVFTFKNKSGNFGFIFFCILFLLYVIFFIIQIKKGIKPVSNFLYNEMIAFGYLNKDDKKFFENKNLTKNKNEISSIIGMKNLKFELKENNNNINNIDACSNKKKKIKKRKSKKKKKIIKNKNNNLQIKNIDTVIEDKKMKSSIQEFNIPKPKIKKTIKEKSIVNEDNNFGIIKLKINSNKKYFPLDSNQSLHNYTFEEAIKYDRRNIFRIFYIYLLSKQIIFRTFLQKSPVELFPIRFTLFIFMLSCDLALNALFYFNDNISKKYQYASSLFLFTFNNNITIIIYSTLVSYILITLLNKLGNSSKAIRNIFRSEEKKMKNKNYVYNEQIKKEIFKSIENILSKFKIKICVLFIIEIILFLFFWYFVTAFCQIYSNTQMSWLLDSFLSILSRLMIELIFAFLFAKLYQIAVGSNFDIIYKIVMCIYDFS